MFSHRLVFNETLAGVPRLVLSAQDTAKIWQPDLYWEKLVDASSISAGAGFGVSLFVYADGRVWRSQQRDMVMSCPLDLSLMPFDMQTCKWSMGMYSSDVDEVLLQWRNGSVALQGWNKRCDLPWVPLNMRQSSIVQVYPEADGSGFSHTLAIAEIDFVRGHPWSFARPYLLPSLVLALISYFAAWINPVQTAARVSLSIICILAVLANANSLQVQLPPNVSKAWLSEFILGNFFFNTASFLEMVLVGFGLMADHWLHDQDSHYTQRLKAKRERNEVLYRVSHGSSGREEVGSSAAVPDACSCSIASAEAAEDEEMQLACAAEVELSQVSEADTSEAGTSEADTTGQVPPPPGPRKVSTRLPSAIAKLWHTTQRIVDADGDGKLTCAELCDCGKIRRRAKRPLLRTLAELRFLDLYWRVLFPLAYVTFLIFKWSEVEYGGRWAQLVANAGGGQGADKC